MAITGINSENQHMRVLAEELYVNGSPVAGGDYVPTVTITALGGTITGATANDTMTAVADAVAASTDTSAASLASVNTAIASIENNFADLQAKVNAILAAMAP